MIGLSTITTKVLASFLLVSTLALGVAYKVIQNQKEDIVELEIKNETLEGTLVVVRSQVEKMKEDTYRLQQKDLHNQQEITKVREQAMKDVNRVEKIVLEKGTLYEKIINRDFKRSQKNLEDLTK